MSQNLLVKSRSSLHSNFRVNHSLDSDFNKHITSENINNSSFDHREDPLDFDVNFTIVSGGLLSQGVEEIFPLFSWFGNIFLEFFMTPRRGSTKNPKLRIS